MSLELKATVKSNDQDIMRKIQAAADNASAESAQDVLNRAVMNAPRDSGALARSGKVVKTATGHQVTFGNGTVKYAARRHRENKKNPQTIGYLTKAGESVTRGNLKKYFR